MGGVGEERSEVDAVIMYEKVKTIKERNENKRGTEYAWHESGREEATGRGRGPEGGRAQGDREGNI